MKPQARVGLARCLGSHTLKGEAAGAPDQRKAWDVRIAIAHEYHLVERYAQTVFRHLAVDFKRLVAEVAPDDAFLDVEQIPGFIGEADDAARKGDAAVFAVDEFGSPDFGEFMRNGGGPDHIADAAGYQVELKLDLRLFGAHCGAQALEQGRHAVMQLQARAPVFQALLGDQPVRARLRQLDHLVQIGRDGVPVLLGQQRVYLVLPERGRIHADAFQETGRAVRGQRVVEIENQGDDVGHEYA